MNVLTVSHLKKGVSMLAFAGMMVGASAAVAVAQSDNGDSSNSSSMQSDSSSGSGAVSSDSFDSSFSAMEKLQDVAKNGKGKIGILLPETTTSARYTSFDAPYLQKAFDKAGLSKDDYTITNAQGSESTQLTQAQSAISQGAKVLLVDPISSGVGASVENYAKEHGVPVIDYDRLTVGGNRDYYVSFDNEDVGKKIGQGFVKCVQDWGVKSPNVLIMDGAATDNNATLFAKGYNGVLKSKFDGGDWTKVGEPAGTWDPSKARTTFEQQMTAHNNINSVVTPNDDNANAVISYLKSINVPANKFPTTGQDATLTGLQNVLAGYQCGTVYKPIYKEAQAAAALALYLRADQKPPQGLVSGSTEDSKGGNAVPSVLVSSIWVTPDNMNDTVVKDNFVDPSKLCAGNYADACKKAGISTSSK
ncbi:sugar ABC transporter substrate-binding protein [Pararhizobium mangrovi]|nr:substrate-binding domain-containing protein [Pararhizobium mangrovi]